MKLFGSKPLYVAASFAVSAMFIALASHVALDAQEPDAAKRAPAAPGDGKAEGKAKGKGKGKAAPVDTLGPGPWDLKSETASIHVTVVTKGLDHPWGLAFVPGGDMLVTERSGRLRVVRGGVLDPTPLGPLPAIRGVGLGGLLDVALHPSFAQNRLIYFAYSKPDAELPARSTAAVARARWDGGSTLTDLKDIFVADAWLGGPGGPMRCCGQGPADGSHGTRLVFDRAGFLYVTLGDRNYGEKSQDPSTHFGKIVRLRDDGTVPPDNPFVGKAGYRPEIYSLGHRNPLGLTLHPVTGELWETEFGPMGGDELNHIEKGKNYGWILATRGTHYDRTPGGTSTPEMTEPALFWGPPSANPGNLTVYNSDKFPPWKGNLLIGMMSRTVIRVTLDAQGKVTGQEKMLTELNQRFRDVRSGPDGFIYALTDETFGAVLRLEPGQ